MSEYISERTEGFDELKELVKDYTPEKVSEITGIPADDIRKRQGCMPHPSVRCCSMRWASHSTAAVRSMCYSTANLAMLCGMVGKEATGVNPLEGTEQRTGCL
jgi:anaerobic selenocysteine-containing dehydrogenase